MSYLAFFSVDAGAPERDPFFEEVPLPHALLQAKPHPLAVIVVTVTCLLGTYALLSRSPVLVHPSTLEMAPARDSDEMPTPPRRPAAHDTAAPGRRY
ncbi:hypothetical protein [Polyangium jinanense]|uniref:Uncharacterized protein n=1 Tax=Polyangium jinanense TaxID=2829994 RepID=A0A9X3XF63_9BACT|nr:hypothetical protein [Polyangium jinanense]MDC3986896.1 hypothetical protein [Polyangium jinanense]